MKCFIIINFSYFKISFIFRKVFLTNITIQLSLIYQRNHSIHFEIKNLVLIWAGKIVFSLYPSEIILVHNDLLKRSNNSKQSHYSFPLPRFPLFLLKEVRRAC